jgi:hypothetical protein
MGTEYNIVYLNTLSPEDAVVTVMFHLSYLSSHKGSNYFDVNILHTGRAAGSAFAIFNTVFIGILHF